MPYGTFLRSPPRVQNPSFACTIPATLIITTLPNFKTISLYLSLTCVISGYIGATAHSIFLILALITWIIALLRREILTPYNPDLKILNYLFLLHAVTAFASTAFYEVNISGALKSIISSYIQWFIFSSSLRSQPQVQNLSPNPALILTFSGTLFSTLVLLQVIGLIPSPDIGIYGIQKQPFTSSALLLFSLFTTLYCLEQAQRLNWFDLRRTYFIAFVLELFALFALGQRSTVIGTIVGILIYLICTQSLNLKAKLLSLSTVSAGLGLAMLSTERFRRKFSKLLDPASLLGTNSMQCRVDLWQQNISAWLLNKSNSLWLGLGEVIPFTCMDVKLTHMHNIFLQQLIRKGLLGFTAWFAFYAWSLVELIKRRSSIAFIAAFIAISIEGLFENWWGDSEVLSGFLFLVSLALISSPQYHSYSNKVIIE